MASKVYPVDGFRCGGFVNLPCGFSLWGAYGWPRGEEGFNSYRNLARLPAHLGLPCGAELVGGIQGLPCGGPVCLPCVLTMWGACRWPRKEERFNSQRNLARLPPPLGLPCGAELVDGPQSLPCGRITLWGIHGFHLWGYPVGRLWVASRGGRI